MSLKTNGKIFISVIFIFLLFSCFSLSGCSAVKGILSSIPFFEEADLDSLTDKAEKAWEEVGKDALKDAAKDAANTVLGNVAETEWPKTDATNGIPKIPSGILSDVSRKNNITEITAKEISPSGYDEYIKILTESLGAPVSKGIYRVENRLISVVYDEETSSLTLTISVVKQNIEDSSEALESSDYSS